jgi:hypothetical protein
MNNVSIIPLIFDLFTGQNYTIDSTKKRGSSPLFGGVNNRFKQYFFERPLCAKSGQSYTQKNPALGRA